MQKVLLWNFTNVMSINLNKKIKLLKFHQVLLMFDVFIAGTSLF